MKYDPTTISFLWDYMVHADGQVLAASLTVPDEGYGREQNISFGSIEKLLNHSMLAQSVWIQRLEGREVQYVDLGPPPRQEFADHWSRVHQKLLAFAKAQTPQSLEKSFCYTTRAGKRLEIESGAAMLHVSDHATYHRGQLNSMIKLAGGKPSPVSLMMYGIQTGVGKEL